MGVVFRCLDVPWSGRLVDVAVELLIWFRLGYTSNESQVTAAFRQLPAVYGYLATGKK